MRLTLIVLTLLCVGCAVHLRAPQDQSAYTALGAPCLTFRSYDDHVSIDRPDWITHMTHCEARFWQATGHTFTSDAERWTVTACDEELIAKAPTAVKATTIIFGDPSFFTRWRHCLEERGIVTKWQTAPKAQ